MKKLYVSTKKYIDEVIAKEPKTKFLSDAGISVNYDGEIFDTYPASSTGTIYSIKIKPVSDSGVNITYTLDVPNEDKLLNFNTSEERIVRYERFDSQETKKVKVVNNALCAIVLFLTND